MPIHPPRHQPIKKQEELNKRENEFIADLRKNLSFEKLNKIAEKYRKAQISLLKAKIHVAKEEVYLKRLDKMEFESLQNDIMFWENKTIDQIIHEFKILKKMNSKEI